MLAVKRWFRKTKTWEAKNASQTCLKSGLISSASAPKAPSFLSCIRGS
jgi:hypothetical protein